MEPVLWIIDSEQWPRACLRAELIERGYDPYGFITVGDAFDSLMRGASPAPKSIVLESRGQNLTHESLEVLHDLRIPTIVLGGNAELSDALLQELKWAIVIKRPVSLGHIADAVERVVSNNRSFDRPK